jgi:outer membrane protein OmpA-like peptidoglycan-associated protein
MNMRARRFALTTISTLLVASVANAQDAGPYMGLGLGLTKVPSTTVTDTTDRKVRFDNGRMGSLSLGYKFGNNWRAEAELSRRANDLKNIGGTTATGKLLATSLMANAFYDFDVNGPISPYLGVGAGITQAKLKNASPFGASSIDDSDRALAMQGIAGLSYAINPNFDLFADYRYLTTQKFKVNTAAGTNASFDAQTHSIMVGLRFNFGTPKPQMKPKPTPVAMPMAQPAPAPVAAPVLPHNYIVFFDWNKTNISPEAAAIIRTAASNAGDMNVIRLSLAGHADRSGSAAYNLKLSQRRADAVKAMFAHMGFKDSEISVIAKGETDPLVATDDGVREPQNRRVEIVLP